MATTSDPLAYFDLSSPSMSMMGSEIRKAREQHWFAKTSFGVAVLRHAEVGELLRHKQLRQGVMSWPAQNGVTSGLLHDWWSRILSGHEGKEHQRLRRLVNPAFSRENIIPVAEAFHSLAEDLVDQFESRETFEFMSDFAEPFSSRALCRLLAIPESDWKAISRETATLGMALSSEIANKRNEIEEALESLLSRAERLIANARENSDSEFLSALVAASDGEDGLTDDELKDMVVLVIFAGMDTTRSQLGQAMVLFGANPEQWELLAERPELAANAVEEVIRFNPAVSWISRVAMSSFTYQDLQVEEGSVLHLMVYSSGTDPLVIDDDVFDIAKERVAHHGFGGGRHHCLGHTVARTDIREALLTLSRRLGNLRYSVDPTLTTATGNTSPIALPFAFDSR
ncbi:cytochrome P450 [Rhodococcus wratislaviensis]|uniref:cytochrome P450 n=1 Tax=Rhodococcus wratislaviensis TaxID=44752 RepID=UPI00365D1C5A